MIEKINVPVENGKPLKVPKVIKEIKPPAVLKPGRDWDGNEVEITSDPYDGPVIDYNELLQRWGYDPKFYELVEPVKISQWQVINDGETQDLWSYKAGVRTRSNVRDIDYDDLVREIKKHRKLNKDNLPTGDSAFIVNLADWQIAKADGYGLKGTVEEILKDIDEVEERIRELRKIGRKLGVLVVAGIGDIGEGCDGNYASQTFNVEVNLRQQLRIARRLIRDAICRWSKLFQEVIVVAVPGNHGENRKDGRMYTTPGDNFDVVVFEEVAEILAANPEAYGHVTFYLPEDEISMTLDICGTRIGFTHGHITGSGASPQQKIQKWWKDQAFTNTDIGSAKILVTGHYHHFSIVNYDIDKTHIQAPARDGGSDWWHNLTGEYSHPGTLTFVVKDNIISDIQVL